METAWLIEHNGGGMAIWWTGNGVSPFSPDANKAVRFCRKGDAEKVAALIVPNSTLKATEHAWYVEAAGPEPIAEPFTCPNCKQPVSKVTQHWQDDSLTERLPAYSCRKPAATVGGVTVSMAERDIEKLIALLEMSRDTFPEITLSLGAV